MTAKTLDDYIGRVTASGAQLLGRIVWFSLTGAIDRSNGRREVQAVRVAHEDLEKWFEELGLDKIFLPAAPKPINAFRTACTETKHTYDLPRDGQSAELLIREVDHNVNFRLHHVMREVKDRKGQRLNYTHVATLKFFRADKNDRKRGNAGSYKATTLRNLDPLDQQNVEVMLANFKERYSTLAELLNSQALRGMLRDYLNSLNAISVRPSGGIYFTHLHQQEAVDALATLVKRLGPNCTFVQVPLPDTTEEREMLTEAYQDEVEDDVRNLLGEIAEYNAKVAKAGEKVSPTKYAEFRERYDAIMANSDEHTKLLGLTQERAAAALELALDAVIDLVNRLDTKSRKT